MTEIWQGAKLQLINFRSYPKAELSLDGRPVVFLGENGAGKTNILEAISLFSPGSGIRRANREDLGFQPMDIGWKLRFEYDDEDYETSAHKGEARRVFINGKPQAQNQLGHRFRQIWLTPAQDRIWHEGNSERRKFWDRIVLSFFPDHSEASLHYERALRERNRLLKEGVFDASWYASLEKSLAQSAQKLILNRRQVSEFLNEEMLRAEGAFPAAQISMSYEGDLPNEQLEDAEFWEELWARERVADMRAGITRMGAHRMSLDAVYVQKHQKAALCSTGEQKALLMAIDLASARLLSYNGHSVIMLLDEAIAHLDNHRRAAFFDEICALEASVFMTGTEMSYYEALGARGQFFSVLQSDEGSKIQCL